MKLDAFCNIQEDTVHRGHKKLDISSIVDIYGSSHLAVEHVRNNMKQMTDLFSIPEASLLCNVTDFFEANGISYDPSYVYQDVRTAVTHLHTSRILHQEIVRDLPRYLVPNPGLTSLLEQWAARDGKRLFLLTNSPWFFVNAGMQHILQRENWQDLFEVVVVDARKPGFYTSQRPFRLYDTVNDTPQYEPVIRRLVKGQVYSGGNLKEFQRLGRYSGPEVLYIGDHVYADLREAARMGGAEFFHTGAVIRELEAEIKRYNQHAYQDLQNWAMTLSVLMAQLQMLVGRDKGGNSARQLLSEWRREMRMLKRTLKELSHPNFGSIFRTHFNSSYFGAAIGRYAELYTARLENLGTLSHGLRLLSS